MRLWALETKKGDPWGISEEVRTMRAALAFPKTSSIINSYKRCEPLDGIVVLLEVCPKEIRKNLDFCPMRL